ncbi:DUF2087 domain-containing protein [Streptomyces pseudoechinosporeus]
MLAQMPPREQDSAPVRGHLGRLIAARFVERMADGSLRADPAVFRRALPAEEAHPGVPRRLVGFFAQGRLTTIPVRPAVRRELLTHLTGTLFETERSYSEREVNEAFRTVHDDTSALRRYCVENGLLVRERDGSSYRRVAAA